MITLSMAIVTMIKALLTIIILLGLLGIGVGAILHGKRECDDNF